MTICYSVIVRVEFLFLSHKKSTANKEHASIHFHNTNVNVLYTEVSLMAEQCAR